MQNLGNINGINAPLSVEDINDRGVAVPDRAALTSSEQAIKNKGWILNPVLDYLFVCGGLLWLLYGLTYLGMSATGTDPNSQAYAFVIYWGAILINDAHGPATLVRVFQSKNTPTSVRYIVTAWAIILLVVGCAAVTHASIAQAFVKITLLWGVQHYIAQTFGIVLIYCLKRDYKLTATERFVFQGLMRSLMYFILIRMLTLPAYGHIQNFMGLEIPFWGPLPPIFVNLSQFVFTVFALAFVSLVIGRLVVKKQFFPLPGLLAIFSVAAVTLSPRMQPFYLLGVTFYHSSQYMAITFSYFLKEHSLQLTGELPRDLIDQFATKRALVYFAVIVAIGYLSTNTIPVYLISAGLPGALLLCTVFSVLNCHHFLADALIWRIRDPKVRKLLV